MLLFGESGMKGMGGHGRVGTVAEDGVAATTMIQILDSNILWDGWDGSWAAGSLVTFLSQRCLYLSLTRKSPRTRS